MNRDLQTECQNHMSINDLACADQIITDGSIRRYAVDGDRRKRDEWYVAHAGISSKGNQYLTCIYGSWKKGVQHIFKSYEQSQIFSDEEKRELRIQHENQQKEVDRKFKEERDKNAIIAQHVWDKESLIIPTSEHHLSYPRAKGIVPIGARFITSNNIHKIVLPLNNTEGKIRSLQFIWMREDGKSEKRFMTGGEKKGNFAIIGEITGNTIFYITEGWATGVSIYMATLCQVIITFDAGNMIPVIEELRNKFPSRKIIIAGDCDETGIKKANEASSIFKCEVIFPDFLDNNKSDSNGKPYTDFNDLHQACGIKEVLRQIKRLDNRQRI